MLRTNNGEKSQNNISGNNNFIGNINGNNNVRNIISNNVNVNTNE
jgi:hypothetical protein